MLINQANAEYRFLWLDVCTELATVEDGICFLSAYPDLNQVTVHEIPSPICMSICVEQRYPCMSCKLASFRPFVKVL